MKSSRWPPIVLPAAMFFALLSPRLAILAQAPPSEVDALAARLVPLVQKAAKKNKPARVVVAEFYSVDGKEPVLQVTLADVVSAALAKTGRELELIDRQQFVGTRIAAKLPIEEVRFDDVARWLAEETGADVVVTGRFSVGTDKVSLTCFVWRSSRQEKLGQEHADFERARLAQQVLQNESNAASGTALEFPRPPNVLMLAGKGLAPVGIRWPRCVSCPSPRFTTEARDERFEGGSVMLEVLVTPEGRAGMIRVTKSLPYGLTANAIRALLRWKFAPAMDVKGNPVPAIVDVEVNFRFVDR